MRDSPSLCVVDTNIVIDLYVGGLIETFFQLPIELAAPDVIIAEMVEPEGTTLVGYGLGSCELSGDQVMMVMHLRARHTTVSTNDLFALVLAEIKAATLLTGDGNLRRLANRRGLIVHGTLWVLDEMVRTGLIDGRRAAEALEQIMTCGSRLPESECRRRIDQWRKAAPPP